MKKYNKDFQQDCRRRYLVNSSETKFPSPNDSEILSSINNLVFRFISVYYPKLTPTTTRISFSL